MNLITDNPYRILGVYANSPIKERVANIGKLKAYMKVGKSLSFPLDLNSLLPNLARTEETVTHAESEITLPNRQLKHAMFWFIKATPIDDIAFNNLIAGNTDKALEIWRKRDNMPSLQNRLVVALITNDWNSAAFAAETLYTYVAQEFVQAIVGDSITISGDELTSMFLEELSQIIDISAFAKHLTNENWKQAIGRITTGPIIEKIESKIREAQQAKGNSEKRYSEGKKLMSAAQNLLPQLRQYMATSDMKYQMIADKLGIEILQCGIDYYNGAEDGDAAIKAKILQDFAASIVVGKMAKDRCNENVQILNNIISQLPPTAVAQEDAAIKKELKSYKDQPEKISYAKSLLNNCKPHLKQLKQKLGVSNTYYLKISTIVVSAAMHNVIEEVNDYQSNPLFRIKIESGLGLDQSDINGLKAVLREAWSANLLMDEFDIESDYKDRYNSNRNTLKRMCEQVGVSTYKPRPTTSSTTTTTTRSSSNSGRQTPPSPRTTPTSNDGSSVGCILGVVTVILGCIFGAATGSFFGGLCIGGIVGLMIYGSIDE